MIETDTPGIDTGEILARIREEVEKYDSRESSLTGGEPVRFFPCPVCTGAGRGSRPRPQAPRDAYVLGELLGFHTESFIDNAYAAILRRDADPEGKKTYLSRLRDGSLSKIDILGRLRYSGEGRARRVPVKGLLPSFIVHSLFKVPVLGWGLRVVAAVLNLPSILKSIQAIECVAMDGRNDGIRADLLELGDHVAQLQEEIGGVLGNTCHRLDTKADKTALAEMARRIETHKRNLLDMERRVRRLLEETGKRLPEPLDESQLTVFAKEGDHLLDAMYVNFEERFRGTREDIKERVRVYLPQVTAAVDACGGLPVLDIGCGRGEWLELLKENRISARGIDLNRIMVSRCREMALDVTEADAIDHLRAMETDAVSVVSGFHIVEHLPFKKLIALFDEVLRVLKPGGMVLFETPNPENLLVGASTFYTDPSHERPIPPVTLSYLAEARGFSRVETVRVNPNPSIKIEDPFLSERFCVGQDYAVIGYKS